MTDLKVTIINILQAAQGPLPTLEISKQAGFKTCKDINPTLYVLLAQKRVEKISDEGGRNPRWLLHQEEVSSPNVNNLRQEILAILERSSEPLSPKCIVSQLEQSISRTEVNSVLHKLLKDKLLIKTPKPDGTDPKWSFIKE